MGKGDKNHKRRKSGPRTKSGQLSRSADAIAHRRSVKARQTFEESPAQTVLRARRRHVRGVKSIEDDRKPVTKDQAATLKLADRGSILGDMYARGVITRQEQQAGETYCDNYLRYAKLNGIPLPTAKIGSYGSVSGGSRPERLEAARLAKAIHERERRALVHCRSGVVWAMRRACITDMPAKESMVVEGLRALVRLDG